MAPYVPDAVGCLLAHAGCVHSAPQRPAITREMLSAVVRTAGGNSSDIYLAGPTRGGNAIGVPAESVIALATQTALCADS